MALVTPVRAPDIHVPNNLDWLKARGGLWYQDLVRTAVSFMGEIINNNKYFSVKRYREQPCTVYQGQGQGERLEGML